MEDIEDKRVNSLQKLVVWRTIDPYPYLQAGRVRGLCGRQSCALTPRQLAKYKKTNESKYAMNMLSPRVGKTSTL
jgi:hypothetical protein